METKPKVLYVSYDGMTDPLGESQVIPYLKGLINNGFEIHILSTEKRDNFLKRKDHILKVLKDIGIEWHYIFYTKKPPVISTIKDINQLSKFAFRLNRKHNFKIVHCRSYIASFIGLKLKRRYGLKFIFDMRGFYPDERVDGNIWDISNPLYRMIYKYFKKKEKVFFKEADYTISLTHAACEIIINKIVGESIPIRVIPCCADQEVFDYRKVSEEDKVSARQNLSVSKDDFIISYLGSIGTWYMLKEMLDFFGILKQKRRNAKFLFITRDNPEELYRQAEICGLNRNDLIIFAANREQVPALLSLSRLSIFFIKPVFSKIASSPTKLAELFGLGIPVICNSNVGDLNKIFEDNNVGYLINNFNEDSYINAVNSIDYILNIDPEEIRKTGENLFSVNIGIDKYSRVYNKILMA